MGRAEEFQKLVNQQARAVKGCFQTTNLGALGMESGLRCCLLVQSITSTAPLGLSGHGIGFPRRGEH